MRGKKDINNNLLKNSEKFVLKHKKILDQTYKNLWDEDKMDEMTKKNSDFVKSMQKESERKFLSQEKGHRNLLNMERRKHLIHR